LLLSDFIKIKDLYIGGTIELFKDEYFGDYQVDSDLFSTIRNIVYDDYQPDILIFIGDDLTEAISVADNILIKEDGDWLVFITTYSEGFRIKLKERFTNEGVLSIK
jgi:hypothetical protein